VKPQLMPLLARNRYTDDEWALATAGRCGWEAESGMRPTVVRCRKPSSPKSMYRLCTRHDRQARQSPGYGK
jgi:hypothetical protein